MRAALLALSFGGLYAAGLRPGPLFGGAPKPEPLPTGRAARIAAKKARKEKAEADKAKARTIKVKARPASQTGQL